MPKRGLADAVGGSPCNLLGYFQPGTPVRNRASPCHAFGILGYARGQCTKLLEWVFRQAKNREFLECIVLGCHLGRLVFLLERLNKNKSRIDGSTNHFEVHGLKDRDDSTKPRSQNKENTNDNFANG